MLHDVTIDTHHPFHGSKRHVVQVDAVSGDDAAAQGAIEAAALAEGVGWKIVGITPSGSDPGPVAAMEGADVEDDVLVPDELEPAKRGPGRPRKDAA